MTQTQRLVSCTHCCGAAVLNTNSPFDSSRQVVRAVTGKAVAPPAPSAGRIYTQLAQAHACGTARLQSLDTDMHMHMLSFRY